MIFRGNAVEVYWLPSATEKVKRIVKYSQRLALGCVALSGLFFYRNEIELGFISIFSALTCFCIALIGWLQRDVLKPMSLDLEQKAFFKGTKTWPANKIKRIVVRRNSGNERFRLGVVNLLRDDELVNVSVNIHFGTLQRETFGTFHSTETAFQFSQEIAGLINFTKEIEIDGAMSN